MSDLKYTVRNLTKEEVPKALDVWRETGMQEGINCLYTWLEVDPEAFKVAVTDEGIFSRIIISLAHFFLVICSDILFYTVELRSFHAEDTNFLGFESILMTEALKLIIFLTHIHKNMAFILI